MCVFCVCTYVCISVGYLSAVMHAYPWVGVGMCLCVCACVSECVCAQELEHIQLLD